MDKDLNYYDLTIKYLLLALPVLLISGPLLPEIAIGIIFFFLLKEFLKKKIKFPEKYFIYGFLFFYIYNIGIITF